MKSRKHKKSATIILVCVFAVGIGLFVLYRNKASIPTNPAQATIPTPDTVPTSVTEPLTPSTSTPTYHVLATTTSAPGAELAKEVGMKNVPFTLALNRLDVKHIPQDAKLIIPDSFADTDIYAPFPTEIAAASDIPKLFIVSKRVQAFAAYENGKRVRWGTVSTGKSTTPTPSRLYATNWKGKLVTSTLEDAYQLPWYFNLDSLEGISMHQFDLPGYPASHSCIRLSEEDAMWIYEWAEQWVLAADGQTMLANGTPVIIFGDYAYGKTAPWKKLAEDPTATTLSTDELRDIVEKYHTEIQERAAEREQVLHPSAQ